MSDHDLNQETVNSSRIELGEILKKERENKTQILGASILIAGALSNLIDRMLYGVTIDYIRIFTSIFNLADLAIVLGAVLLLKKSTNHHTN